MLRPLREDEVQVQWRHVRSRRDLEVPGRLRDVRVCQRGTYIKRERSEVEASNRLKIVSFQPVQGGSVKFSFIYNHIKSNLWHVLIRFAFKAN